MSQRANDLKMLDELLDEHLDELTTRQMEAFSDMRLGLRTYPTGNLNDKQREWLTNVHRQIIPQYENMVSQGLIQAPKKPGERGYVALMVGTLAKKPPPLPKEPERPKRMTAEHRPFRVTGLDERDDDE